MAEIVLLTMLIAAALYAVFGGADFGLGMIEPWLGPSRKQQVDAALSPVWEANHVWLVLLIVLAFVGFPTLFAQLSVSLHIPLLLVLLGIVARGSAFTFRHYDPEPAQLSTWYTWAFRLGSLLTPLFLGVIVAASVQGGINEDSTSGAYQVFVAPWNTAFCWLTGVFVCALFAFQGAALLAAEQADARGDAGCASPLPLIALSRRLHALSIVLGGLVLARAYVAELPWFDAFVQRSFCLGALGLATLLIPVVALSFARGAPWLLRLSVGCQVCCVLLGLLAAEYPILLRTQQRAISLGDAAAPAATLRALVITVAIGLALILPALLYLWRVYKLAPQKP